MSGTKKILVINCGSSSLKFSLFESGRDLKETAMGLIDKIGSNECKLTFKSKEENKEKHLGIKVKVKNHTEAVRLALQTLDAKGIKLVAHRVVHGGEKYEKPTILNAAVIKTIKTLIPLAPLHNPINLEGILACKKLLPRIKQAAVFDTAFYQTLEEKAFLYAIPQELYRKHGIRRYGFHGTNHKYVTEKVIKLLGNKPNLKIISCHLGNGSSITASLNGKAVDTSMGFTPLEGVPMGSRCGSIDPSVVLKIQELKKFTPKRTAEFLNNECGLKGLSGISSDMRDIYAAYLKKDKNAVLTIEHLSYAIAKYVGAYAASLNGLDALIFTGGLGEKAFYVREKVCEYLKYLGKIKVFVIEANESYQIAKEALKAK